MYMLRLAFYGRDEVFHCLGVIIERRLDLSICIISYSLCNKVPLEINILILGTKFSQASNIFGYVDSISGAEYTGFSQGKQTYSFP